METKTTKKILASCVILLGVTYSMYNAVNDYGLRTNKLHKNIAAQSDDTSGETTGGGTCDGSKILCSSYLHREIKNITATTNKEGSMNVLGLSLGGYKSNTTYTVSVADYSCRQHSDKRNVCDRSKERTEFISLSEGENTNGESTNGESTNGN